MKGWGAKKFGMSLETREIKLFWRDDPGFCWDIPAVPEKFEKQKFVFNFCLLNRIWGFPSFLPLAITAFGAPEGYFSIAIIGFGAFEFIVRKYYYRLGKMENDPGGHLKKC